MCAVCSITEDDVKIISVQANHESQRVQHIKIIIVIVIVHNVGRMMVMSMVITTIFIALVAVVMTMPVIIAIY